jgi:hypothetical protein
MYMRISPGLLLSVSWFALLAGCQIAENPGPELPASTPMLQPPGKLSAPVEISYQLLAQPRLGQPLEIMVSARALDQSQDVTLRVTPDSGLSLSSPALLTLRSPRAGEGREDRMVVTPLLEGRSFLNVVATVNVNGQPMQKAIAIPIQVGPVVQPLSDPPRDAEGTPVRSMPAQETTD